jgi:hypothetical protein
MVKPLTKPLITKKTPLNYDSDTPMEYQKSKKSRKQINQEYYQKNKERRNNQEKERYKQKRELNQQQEKEQSSKYYEAESIKILMSLKEYTELNPEKRKRWSDFIWTFKELNKVGVSNIVEVMRLRELAENLINDYWVTAKSEKKLRSKSWNSLDQGQQQRLIRYWGYEKARIENGYLEEEERLTMKSQEYLKEIELAKFHEERGKTKCSCYSCQAKKAIQKEVKARIKKEIEEHDRQSGSEKEECSECGKLRVLDEESGVCKKCLEDYE